MWSENIRKDIKILNEMEKKFIFVERLDKNKTLINYEKKLIDRIKDDHSVSTPEEVIEKVIDNDPTPNQKYGLWILKTYINKGINYTEDFGRIKKALILFNKFKSRIEIKDINKIESLSKLEDIVDPFKEEKTGKEFDKEEREKIKKEIEVVYDGPEGKILVPQTEKSSCFLGRGTKWCTSADNNNYFDYFNRKGNLYVILPNDGSKYQLHFETVKLRDEKDGPVEFKEFDKKYPWVFGNLKITEEEQKLAVQQNGRVIKFIKNPSETVKRLAVQQNGNVIKFIKRPSEEVQRLAVQQDGLAIKYIRYPNEEIQKIAVQKHDLAFLYILNNGTSPSYEVQKLAVQQNGRAIVHIIDYGIKPSEEIKAIARKNGWDG